MGGEAGHIRRKAGDRGWIEALAALSKGLFTLLGFRHAGIPREFLHLVEDCRNGPPWFVRGLRTWASRFPNIHLAR